MPDTSIIDARHFLDDRGAVPPQASRRGIVRQVASVIEALTLRDGLSEVSGSIPCCRRPGRMACPGRITASVKPDAQITWQCPACGDRGWISHWQRTPWDQGGRFGLPEVRRLRYRSGMIEQAKDEDSLPSVSLAGDALTRELLVAIHDNRLLDTAGEYGDPRVGDPIQFDELLIEHAAGTVTIRVFNRAIMLLHTNDELYVRFHRVYSLLAPRSSENLGRGHKSSI